MKYEGFIKKSRTIDFTALIVGLGILVENMPLLKESLGEYYGYAFILVAIVYGILRKITTKPLGGK